MKRILKALIRTTVTRVVLNCIYNALSYQNRERIHLRYSKLFEPNEYVGENTWWYVEFFGKMIKMPLSNWNQALTIAAYDYKVIQFYEDIVRSRRYSAFVDVGANFGTHTLMFAAHGFDTYSFEPNPECAQFLRDRIWNNDYKRTHTFNLAVGNEQKSTKLYFPEDQSWLGIVGDNKDAAFDQKLESDSECPKIKRDTPMKEVTVNMIPLDKIYDDLRPFHRVLIKIDTEGHELEVMKGAYRIIADLKPMILFESFKSDQRKKLYDYLFWQNYNIFELGYPRTPLYAQEFIDSDSMNFVATHRTYPCE